MPHQVHPAFGETLRKIGLPFAGVNYLTHIDDTRKIAYIETPKVACTSIKKFMMDQYVGGTFELLRPGMVHDRKRSPLKQFSNLHPRVALPVLMGADYRRFSFVRNPYSRVLSGYLDKLVTNEYERGRFLPMMGFEPGSHPTLLEFLERLALMKEPGIDIHFMTQASLLMVDHVEYDFIGRFERFEQDFLRLQAKFFDVEQPEQSYEGFGKHHASNANDKIAQYFGDREIELVQQIYARDFDLFEYSRDLAHASDLAHPVIVTALKSDALRAEQVPQLATRIVAAAVEGEEVAVSTYHEATEDVAPKARLALCDMLIQRLPRVAWFIEEAARLEQEQGNPHLACQRWSELSSRFPETMTWQLEYPFALARAGFYGRALKALKTTHKLKFQEDGFREDYVNYTLHMLPTLAAEQGEFAMNFLDTLATKLTTKTFLDELMRVREASPEVVQKSTKIVTGHLSCAKAAAGWPFLSALFSDGQDKAVADLNAKYLGEQNGSEAENVHKARAVLFGT